ncbi:hypothetical protein D3C76_982620 [compost metagenome]
MKQRRVDDIRRLTEFFLQCIRQQWLGELGDAFEILEGRGQRLAGSVALCLTVEQGLAQCQGCLGIQFRGRLDESLGWIARLCHGLEMGGDQVTRPVGKAALDKRNMKSRLSGYGRVRHDVAPDARLRAHQDTTAIPRHGGTYL